MGARTWRLGLRRRVLARGESVIAGAGLLAGVLLLAVLAGLAIGTHAIHEDLLRREARERAEGLEAAIARAAPSVLSAEGLTGLRRFVQDVGGQIADGGARIELGDGSVLASSRAAEITVVEMPERLASVGAEASAGGTVVDLGNGLAVVRCDIGAESGAGAGWTAALGLDDDGWMIQTVIGGAGAASLLGLWLVYRRVRRRVGALGAIREALLDAASGEVTGGALVVSERMGDVARAWNALIADREALRERLMRDRAGEALSGSRGGRGDADDACDALWHGVLVLDDAGRVRYGNGAARALMGLSREAMEGKGFEEIVEDPSLRSAVAKVVRGEVRRRVSLELERTGEREDVLRFTVRPLRGADGGVAVVVIEDVTQQRVAGRATSGFVAQATHELRTPLTNIRLYAEELIELNEGEASERARCLMVINQEARRLERLVGDMLSVSEMESGSMSLRIADVRLEPLFAELREEFEGAAREKGVGLSFRMPAKYPVFGADRDKLMVVLHNLLGNAVKYTPEGGRVDVVVEAGDEELRVEVRDTGPGIGEEDRERVFEAFYRTEGARTSGATGTGLGLAIAREIARLHGGEIALESEVGRGSTFTLRVPNAGVMDRAMAA